MSESLSPAARPPGAAASLLMVLGGTALTAAAFYPGYLDGDSSFQYMQVLTGFYKDKDPVLMTWVWTGLNRLIEGSGGLFLATLLAFWTGLVLTLRPWARGPVALAVASLVVALWLPNLGMLSQIQKDVGMAAALLLACGLLVQADRSRSLTLLLLALAALWYGLSVRYNGLLAVLPLTLALVSLLVRDHLPSGLAARLHNLWGQAIAALLLTALMVAGSLAVSEAILGKDGERLKDWAAGAFFSSDLVGISVRSGRNLLPPGVYYPEDPLRLEELARIYHPHTSYDLYWEGLGSPPGRRLRTEGSPDKLVKLRDAWGSAIRQEPVAYLAHRRDLFLAHLGWRPDSPYRTVMFLVWAKDAQGREIYYYPYRGPNVFRLPHNQQLVRLLQWSAGTPLFHPWIYLLLSAGVTAAAFLRGHPARGLIGLLAASGWLYALAYAAIGVSAEFRYLWWTVLCACLQAAVWVLGGRSRATVQGT